ncbi:MAG: T9SS type A sorting domain-containing protein [Flavobacteriales bacterium]|nr:T9SS type A sorting domain-containing protein [Flavobacteriales bacterium]MCC6939306.1 T9SS type A sorting domain-containing protein [Flavobacteriales bacterium]
MHRTLTLPLLFTVATLSAQTITSSGFNWVPAELTVTAGTPIAVTVTGNHVMREVSEDTWNANGTTSNGGFEYSSGTHTLTLDVPGTYWYVCVTHINSGMKGKIIVEANTGLNEGEATLDLTLSPNPANQDFTVTSDPSKASAIALMDLQGRQVLRQHLTGNDRIVVGQLPEGNYVAVILDLQGSMMEQRRMSIVH